MLVLVVDVANVMGSRPDGWWRDRAGAATRLMAALVPLSLSLPVEEVEPVDRIGRIVAVIEGRSRAAIDPPGIEVVRAPADGDSTIVEIAAQVLADGGIPLVVTADRGLRERLPSGSRNAGPTWLLDLIA